MSFSYFSFWQRLAHHYQRQFSELRKPYGLTQTEAELLIFLKEKNGLGTATEFVKESGVSKSQTSFAVEKLIQKGLLCSRRDSKNRRLNRLTATQEGSRLAKQLCDCKDCFREKLLLKISPAERTQLFATLKKIEQAVL